MKTRAEKIDDQAKAEFLAQVAELWPIATGSLSLTRSPCTRKSCKLCASGRKHPKLLYMCWDGDKHKGMYVRPQHADQVRQAIANGQKLRQLVTAAGRDLILSLRKESEA